MNQYLFADCSLLISEYPAMDSLPGPMDDLSRSLTPLSSTADSTDEVDRLLTGPFTPERSLANDHVDEESDLSPLTSSDEEIEDIGTTPRLARSMRALRPRGAKAPASNMEPTTTNPRASSPPVPSSPVEQPSKASRKRKRTDSLTTKPSPTVLESGPKPGSYVSEDRCHQCRNLPRYAFMRCTSKDESGIACKRLFCVSCITKRSALFILDSYPMILTCRNRYPTDVDFDPRLKKWKCPFCGGICNCTKCCFKRNVTYVSTANVKIDQDTLLYYAALMPGNSNSKERPPPVPKPPKSAKKSKLTGKSKSKPSQSAAEAKQAAENNNVLQAVALNSTTTRDIESVIRGLADTAAIFERFGCASGEYWGVVFSNVDAGRIGVAYVGDKLPDILFLRDNDNGGQAEEAPPPAKRLRVSSRLST